MDVFRLTFVEYFPGQLSVSATRTHLRKPKCPRNASPALHTFLQLLPCCLFLPQLLFPISVMGHHRILGTYQSQEEAQGHLGSSASGPRCGCHGSWLQPFLTILVAVHTSPQRAASAWAHLLTPVPSTSFCPGFPDRVKNGFTSNKICFPRG